ncbi:MAG TPA: alkaline phosphatase PhoX, partial [Polyangiaceae bacterium]|nr:alkaline phosphatase PhoX [Polyangiaceae bacterium]
AAVPPTVAAAKAVFNPYAYGYMTEVSVTEDGVPTVKKHYAAGRRAEELPYVMPDQKTVYLTDDGSNDAFFMFVATTPGDLSSGKLYAARWYQTSPNGAAHGTADIGWIQLGPSATDAEVKALIDANTKFSDIFESETPNADGTCPGAASGFKSNIVDVSYSVKTECLKLKPGMELAASRLESRRYAGYVGATTEFRKNEGISFNPEGSRLYVAYSELNNGVLDNDQTSKRDLGGPNHMRLAQNNCGGVFEFPVSPDSTIGSDYVVHGASSLIEGIWLANPAAPNRYPDDSPYGKSASGTAGTDKNLCSINGIANPDNISYLPGYDTLLIGEDSGTEHQNDAVWAFNVVSKELTRIVTTPYGSETTGVYYYPNLNGHAYIKVQVQHPFGESDSDQAPVDSADRQSYVGYVGPLPAMR